MQRDLKVGLSLGVLVLGVVGALLFRREQISETPKRTLKAAHEYDERIAEGRLTPYMTGDLEFDQDDTDKSEKNAKQTAGRPAHAEPPSWLNDDEDPFQVARKEDGKFDFRHPVNSNDSPVVPLQPRQSAAASDPQAVAHAELRTHVIQSGDSLSLLAERYLGSQGRFQEIYDANRDVLTDIDRLPLGTSIVIPAATKMANQVHKTPGGPTARTAMSQPEKARGKITDVSIFEPLAPPDETTTPNSPSTAIVEKPAAEAPSTVKVQETKKFVNPGRLPFANQQHVKPAAPQRKLLDPDGEDFAPLKPTTAGEATSDTVPEARRYQVRKGDSLEKISTKIYGNAKRAGDIYAANRELLNSPNAVREGQELVLPE